MGNRKLTSGLKSRAKRLIRLIAAVAAVGLGGSSAMAAYTPFTPTNAGFGELSSLQIVQQVYGLSFSVVGNNFEDTTNLTGGILVRVNDTTGSNPGGPLNILAGQMGNNDQVYTDGVAAATARARFAGKNQDFGYVLGATGGTFQNLFSVTAGFLDTNAAGSGPSSLTDFRSFFMPGDTPTWRFARRDLLTGVQTTAEADNGNVDHVLTYKYYANKQDYGDGEVNDQLGQFSYVLFFEDRPDSLVPVSDRDFNDLVVEITPTAQGNFAPIPAPVSASAVGLLSLAVMKFRRSRRQSA